MAIIYGACTGTNGGKYNVWLDVAVNSQSTENNSSNVTVFLKLARNDGYSNSAYNLYADQNTVSLSVGGTERQSGGFTFDTRNCVTDTLAQWTGDVSHNADGTLSLSVAGSFTSRNSGLSGGSVMGNAQLPTIPRESAVTFSSSSVSPGDSVTATVAASSNAFSHRIVYSIASYSQTQNLAAGTTADTFTVPALWAGAVTAGSSGVISVEFTTFSGSTAVGTKHSTLLFTIPDTSGSKPDFNLVVTRRDNDVPSSWGVYVQGKSGVTVNIADAAYKYGASFASVAVSVGRLRQNTVPAVFTHLTQYGTVTVSVTLTDSRGFSCTKTEDIYIYPYESPSVRLYSVERCLSDGTLSDNGTYASALASFSCYTCGGNNTVSCTLSYGDASVNIPQSNERAVFGGGNLLPTSSYTVTVTAEDAFTSSQAKRVLSTAGVALNIRPGGKGVGIGKYCTADEKIQCKWDIYTDGKIYDNASNSPLVRYSSFLNSVSVSFRGAGGYLCGRKLLSGNELSFTAGHGGYYSDVSVSLPTGVFASGFMIDSVICTAESAGSFIASSFVSGSGSAVTVRCWCPVQPDVTTDIYVNIAVFYSAL